MDLSRQEYPTLLRSFSPNHAVAVLDERVKLIAKINSDIADWLAERRRVEDTYVQGLRKLVGKRPHEASADLGVFQTPWQSIVNSMDALAQSHSILAQKIEADVERPLKEYQSQNQEMQSMSTIQGNLYVIAKDVENAQKKAAKLNTGKSSTTKVANATSDVEAASQQWESQAPYVFEQLQALDESRVNHLRDVLTQLETHEVDQVERNRTTAESCLNTLLNINAQEEISGFVAKKTAIVPTISDGRGSWNRTGSSAGAPIPPPELPPAAPTPSKKPQDDAEEDKFSPYSASSSRMGPPPSKKGFGGLRRLGTVLARHDKGRKGMDRPPSPEKRSRTGRNPLRRGPSSRYDMQKMDSPPQTSSSYLSSQAPQLDDSFTKTTTTTQSTNRPSSPPQTLAATNETDMPVISTPAQVSTIPLTNGIQNSQNDTTVQGTKASAQSPEAQRDAEGNSTPSNAVDDITRAQQEAAAASDEVDQNQFRLNIRDAPIREEDQAAQQTAFSSVANTLRAQASQVATPRKPSSNRGRRDVRNTVFVPSGQSPESAGLGGPPVPAAPPFNIASTPPMPHDTFRGSDAQSIRSAHSMSSTANAVITHPQMHHPGLNASVVETVSATFVQGHVTKAAVVGEMALQHNATDTVAAPVSETVRLENFPVLEKVAPNPTFITQQPSTSGEYSVNLSSATRPTVAFKYQVHLDDSSLAAHAPISLTPTWKVEPAQASVIVNYNFNPAFVSPTQRSVSLKNVIIFVNVDSTKANSCQSKPAGIFSKEKSMIYWKLGEMMLDGHAAAAQKLVARFNTESEGKAGNVEVRWEISGEQAAGLGSGLGISQTGSGKDESSGSDPFADESTSAALSGTWKAVPLTRKIVSGRYIAT